MLLVSRIFHLLFAIPEAIARPAIPVLKAFPRLVPAAAPADPSLSRTAHLQAPVEGFTKSTLVSVNPATLRLPATSSKAAGQAKIQGARIGRRLHHSSGSPSLRLLACSSSASL